MPQCCAVPLGSKKKTGSHKFPKDKIRLKQWLVAIRRDRFTPTNNSLICKDYFSKDDYELPKESVLEKHVSASLMSKKIQCQVDSHGRKQPIYLLHHKRKEQQQRCLDRDTRKKENMEKTKQNVFLNTSDMLSLDCAEVEIISQIKYSSTTPNDVGVQCDFCECHTNLPNNLKIPHQGSKRPNKEKQFLIENMMDINNSAEVHFFTGFQSFDHFKFIFNLFGDEVNYLKYYPHMKIVKEHVLSPCDEFVLTVIKLRRNT